MPETSNTKEPIAVEVDVPRFYIPGTPERRAYTLALQDIVSHLCTVTNTWLSHSHSDSDLLRENQATERSPLLVIRPTSYGGISASVQAGMGIDLEAGGQLDSHHKLPKTPLQPQMHDDSRESTYSVQILLSLYASLVSMLQLLHTSSYSPLAVHPICIAISLGLVFVTVTASALVVAFRMHHGSERCRWWASRICYGTYITSLLAAGFITRVFF